MHLEEPNKDSISALHNEGDDAAARNLFMINNGVFQEMGRINAEAVYEL